MYKQLIFIFFSLIFVLNFQSCTGFKSLVSTGTGTGDLSSTQLATAKEVFRTSVYAVAQKNCAGCHATSQQPLFAQTDVDISYDISKAGKTPSGKKYADFVNVASSYFIEQAKNNHCNTNNPAAKKVCTGDGTEMLAAITMWAPYEAALQPPPPKGGTNGVRKVVRLETRTYVASTLNEIFGPSAVSITRNAVSNNPISFGGPCDPYSNGCISSNTQAPLIPGVTSARSALLYRTCDKLMSVDTAVEYARGLTGAASSGTLPTPAQISSAYGLFYVGRVAPLNVTNALQAAITQTTTLSYPTIEGWRVLFLTLCHAGDWQIP